LRSAVLAGLLAALPALGAVGEEPLATRAPDAAISFEAPADRATLKQAIDRALARNPTIAIASAELRLAADLVEQVRSAALPNAILAGQYIRYDAAGGFTYPTEIGTGTVLVNPNTFVGSLQITVPVVAPTAWVAWSHAHDSVKAASWTEQDARRQIAIAVAHAFLSVIAQKRVVDASRRASETDHVHYEYTRRRLNGGLGTPLDEMRARQQWQSDRSSLQQAILGLERTQEALGVLLGEEHPVDNVDEPWFEVPKDPREQGDALARAAQTRPDLLALTARQLVARHGVRDAWADYMPTLSAVAEPLYQAPPSEYEPTWSWELLLTLSWTIYDGGLRYGQEKERVELLTEADKLLEGQLRQAGSDIRLGFEAVSRNDAALGSALDAAAASHQALEVANLQFKVGATTNIDVVDAERRAHDADTVAAIVEDSARQARLDLLAAMGRFP
jgi:outer membrane protein TolC